MQNYRIFSYLSVLSLLLFMGCAQVQYGCLDPNAVNYDPGADKDCSQKANSCNCTYPQLRLELNILRNSEKGFKKDTMYDVNNKKYYLEGLHLYLSDFKLIDKNGKEYLTTDTVTLRFDSQSPQIVQDGYYKFNPSEGSTVSFLGDRTWRNTGSFSKVSFKVGVSNPASSTNATKFRPNHPLYFSTDSLWSSTLGFPHFGIKVKRDNDVKIIEKIYAYGDSFPIDYTLDFPTELVVSSSQDAFSVKLEIDYLSLFNNINIAGSNEKIINEIRSNLTKAIKLL